MYPILWQSGPITIHALWIMFTLGLIIAVFVFLKTTKRQRLNLKILLDHYFSLIIISLIFARVFFLIRHWQFYIFTENPFLSFFAIWDKGLSFWGGLTGFVLLFFFFIHRQHKNINSWADLLITPILIIIIFGSIGNLLAGLSYGFETTLPWGITFSSPNVKYTVPIHPTQIYRLLYTIPILFLLPYFPKWLPFLKKKGNLALIIIFLYNFFRFIEEFFHGDDDIYITILRLNHILTFFFCLLSGVLLYKQFLKWRTS